MLITRAIGRVISGTYIYLPLCGLLPRAFARGWEGASVSSRPLLGHKKWMLRQQYHEAVCLTGGLGLGRGLRTCISKSQMMLAVLVQGPHFENQCFRYYSLNYEQWRHLWICSSLNSSFLSHINLVSCVITFTLLVFSKLHFFLIVITMLSVLCI